MHVDYTHCAVCMRGVRKRLVTTRLETRMHLLVVNGVGRRGGCDGETCTWAHLLLVHDGGGFDVARNLVRGWLVQNEPFAPVSGAVGVEAGLQLAEFIGEVFTDLFKVRYTHLFL